MNDIRQKIQRCISASSSLQVSRSRGVTVKPCVMHAVVEVFDCHAGKIGPCSDCGFDALSKALFAREAQLLD